jgi:hypothetical protein
VSDTETTEVMISYAFQLSTAGIRLKLYDSYVKHPPVEATFVAPSNTVSDLV